MHTCRLIEVFGVCQFVRQEPTLVRVKEGVADGGERVADVIVMQRFEDVRHLDASLCGFAGFKPSSRADLLVETQGVHGRPAATQIVVQSILQIHLYIL